MSLFSRSVAVLALASLASGVTAQTEPDRSCRLGPRTTQYAYGWFRSTSAASPDAYPLLGNVFAVHARPIVSCGVAELGRSDCVPWGKLSNAQRLQGYGAKARATLQPWLVEFATAAHVVKEVCAVVDEEKMKVDLRIIRSDKSEDPAVNIAIDKGWCANHQRAATDRYQASLQQKGAVAGRGQCDTLILAPVSDLYLFSQIVIVNERHAIIPLSMAPLPRSDSVQVKMPGFRAFSSNSEVRREVDGLFFTDGQAEKGTKLSCLAQIYAIPNSPVSAGDSGSPVILSDRNGDAVIGLVVQEGLKLPAESRAEAIAQYGEAAKRPEGDADAGKADPRIISYTSTELAAKSAQFIPLIRRPEELLAAMDNFDKQLSELVGSKIQPTYFALPFLWRSLSELAMSVDSYAKDLLGENARFMDPLERTALLNKAFSAARQQMLSAGKSEEDVRKQIAFAQGAAPCYQQREP